MVGKPLGAAYAGASAGSPVQASMAHESTLCAMSFRVVGEWPATSRHMEASQRRCFKAASNGRWALLAHILAEFPQLATAKDDSGAGGAAMVVGFQSVSTSLTSLSNSSKAYKSYKELVERFPRAILCRGT